MKSRRTRKRNSRRKIRMSRKHQGGEPMTEPIRNVSIDAEPVITAPVIAEPIAEPIANAPVQNEFSVIENAMRAESEKMIQKNGLEAVIANLENLIKINIKDNSQNKIINIPGQTHEAIKNFTEDLINIQKKLLVELKKRKQNTSVNTNKNKNK